MPKVKIYGSETDKQILAAIYCPACDCEHAFTIKSPDRSPWTWNNDMEKPTFRPSMLFRSGSFVGKGFIDPPGLPGRRCHSFVTNGTIQFLNDCSHDMKNKTVELPEIK